MRTSPVPHLGCPQGLVTAAGMGLSPWDEAEPSGGAQQLSIPLLPVAVLEARGTVMPSNNSSRYPDPLFSRTGAVRDCVYSPLMAWQSLAQCWHCCAAIHGIPGSFGGVGAHVLSWWCWSIRGQETC